MANVRSVTSVAPSTGVPSSCAAMRRRYRFPFGTAPTSHVYVRADPGRVTIGFQVTPTSSLEASVKFASPTPVPYADAVQFTVMEGPPKVPPFGAVMPRSG